MWVGFSEPDDVKVIPPEERGGSVFQQALVCGNRSSGLNKYDSS